MKTETDVQKEIMQAAQNEMQSIVFRNNTGAYRDGSRYVRYGLCVGSSDIIACTPVEITPEMVGCTLGVFTAIEVKRDERALRAWNNYSTKTAAHQHGFITHINDNGGIAFASCSADNISVAFSAILQERIRQKDEEASQK